MRRPIPEAQREEPPKKAAVDHVKALILERVAAQRVTAADCARAMGVCASTWYDRLRQSTDQWPLGDLLHVAEYLGIGIDDLRAAIRYERNRRYE